MTSTTPYDISTLRVILPRMAIFLVVARAPSIAAAAKSLGMSRASTSEAVSSLEEALGCTLLHRTTRSLSLTDAGIELMDYCERVTDAGLKAMTVADWHDKEPRGLLRVSCSAGFIASALVAPVLAQMVQAHDVRVELHTSSRPVDLVAERFDAAVRVGSPRSSSMRIKRLGRTQEILVSSPQYAELVSSPQQLTDVPFVIQRGQPTSFSLTSSSGSDLHVALEASVTAEDTAGLVTMIKAGAGVAVIPKIILQSDGDSLVQLLPEYTVRVVDIYLLTASARQRSAKLMRFAELIQARWDELSRHSSP